MDKLYKDFSIDLTERSLAYSGINMLIELNNMTNYFQNPRTQDTGNCKDGVAFDLWVSNKEHCPSGYKYITPNITKQNNNFGSSSCLYLGDWDGTSTREKRYSSCPTAFSDKVFVYIENLNKYQKDIKNTIDDNLLIDLKE